MHLTVIYNINITLHVVDFTLHFTTLCTALHFPSLHYTSLPCTSLHFTSLQYTSLHCISLHFTALHRTPPHRTAVVAAFISVSQSRVQWRVTHRSVEILTHNFHTYAVCERKTQEFAFFCFHNLGPLVSSDV